MNYKPTEDQINKYRKRQTEEAERKLDTMVEFLKENGPMQSEKLKKKYKCGTELAKEAMTLAGYGGITANYWRKKIKSGEVEAFSKSRVNMNYSITRMARPSGINYLTVGWV